MRLLAALLLTISLLTWAAGQFIDAVHESVNHGVLNPTHQTR